MGFLSFLLLACLGAFLLRRYTKVSTPNLFLLFLNIVPLSIFLLFLLIDATHLCMFDPVNSAPTACVIPGLKSFVEFVFNTLLLPFFMLRIVLLVGFLVPISFSIPDEVRKGTTHRTPLEFWLNRGILVMSLVLTLLGVLVASILFLKQ